MTTSSSGTGRAAQGVASLKTLRHVLAATIKGACKPQTQSDLRAHGTSEGSGLYGQHTTSFIPTGAHRQGGMQV